MSEISGSHVLMSNISLDESSYGPVPILRLAYGVIQKFSTGFYQGKEIPWIS